MLGVVDDVAIVIQREHAVTYACRGQEEKRASVSVDALVGSNVPE